MSQHDQSMSDTCADCGEPWPCPHNVGWKKGFGFGFLTATILNGATVIAVSLIVWMLP